MSSDEEPTDKELKATIRKLVPKVDLQKTGVKSFTKILSKEFGGIDLKHRSAFIKEALSEAINELSDDDESESESSSEEEELKKPPKKRQKASGGGGGGGGGTKGLAVKKEISEKLANFLQQGNEMARTEIVKALWDYIKENDLQNPENRREIILDDAMKEVFEVDRFTMFTMNKYIAAHIHPYKPVDLTSPPKGSPKKRKRRKSKQDEADKKKKRKPKKPGLQPPYRLSPAMIKVVGKDILPRPQVVTALWTYIKANDLQVSAFNCTM